MCWQHAPFLLHFVRFWVLFLLQYRWYYCTPFNILNQVEYSTQQLNASDKFYCGTVYLRHCTVINFTEMYI